MEYINIRFAEFTALLEGPTDSPMEMLLRNFESLACPYSKPDTKISVIRTDKGYRLSKDEKDPGLEFEASELIYEVEGHLVIAAQLAKPQLLFLHAATLVVNNKSILLVGESGAGKSTLCWALTCKGYRYLSDELAPLYLREHRYWSYSYPHAICLKQPPSSPFELPKQAFFSGRTWHIPDLVTEQSNYSTMISHVFFIDRSFGLETRISQLASAEIAHRLYPHVLNALAHPGGGLHLVADIAQHVEGFILNSSDLDCACNIISEVTSG